MMSQTTYCRSVTIPNGVITAHVIKDHDQPTGMYIERRSHVSGGIETENMFPFLFACGLMPTEANLTHILHFLSNSQLL